MPRDKGTLQPPASQDLQPAKPEPPADLFEQLDKLHEEAAETSKPARPPDSFTMSIYRERYNLSYAVARKEIEKGRKAGTIKLIGSSSGAYYVFTSQKRTNP